MVERHAEDVRVGSSILPQGTIIRLLISSFTKSETWVRIPPEVLRQLGSLAGERRHYISNALCQGIA